MGLRRPVWLRRAEAKLRPLDYWSRRLALGAGMGAGIAAGVGIAWVGSLWAVAAGAALLGVAGWLAISGEPIAVLREVAPALKPRGPTPADSRKWDQPGPERSKAEGSLLEIAEEAGDLRAPETERLTGRALERSKAEGSLLEIAEEAGDLRAPETERLVGREPERGLLSDALGLVWLPGGTFLMGSAEEDPRAFDDERPQHEVTVKPFAMASFLVRQSLYREVIVESPYGTIMDADPSDIKGDDLPVTDVSWYDAVRFCNALSLREGHTPAYQIGEGDEPSVDVDPDADGFRLPTEAEWEYAARAGTTTAWSFGDEEHRIDDFAWYGGNSGGEAHPVGTKPPNAWGLYDMHGNVWEWCWDFYQSYTANESAKTVPTTRSLGRVVRGGSFFHEPRVLRSSDRVRHRPEDRFRVLGFRCARGGARQH